MARARRTTTAAKSVLIIACLLAASARPGLTDGIPLPPSGGYNCGVIALGTLLHQEGRPVPLDRLAACLPPTPPQGYSLVQLRDAARALGVELAGVELSKDPSRLDRPALVHLRRGEHGHFLVIRPVGHSRHLIQVLDADSPPDVVDAERVYGSSEWTGLALVPTRAYWPGRAAAVAAAIGLVGLIGLVVTSGKRRRAAAQLGRP